MSDGKQQKLNEAFEKSEWAKQFGAVRWRVTYKNGEVFTGKSQGANYERAMQKN